MSNYNDYKRKALKDPEVRAEYDALQPEYDIIQAIIGACNKEGLTQKELSDRTGITQADIRRIENGTRNPSLAMVKRLANGLGMRLKFEFIPEGTVKTAKDWNLITFRHSSGRAFDQGNKSSGKKTPECRKWLSHIN